MLWVSRLPRTLAVLLAGTAVAVAGLIMQLMVRNRFVEPSTVGTVESATLGILVVTVALPAAPLMLKMGVASIFALGGTALFLAVLNRLPARNTLLVPIVGIMLGGVIGSVTTFFAYKYDLLQTLSNWMIGDFSGVLRGRYELLWIVAILTVIGYVAADRFTVAGLGADFTTNLGMNYKAIMRLGLVLVSLISAVVVTTVGAVPFLGLIVPNIVSLLFGDNLRRAVPWTALFRRRIRADLRHHRPHHPLPLRGAGGHGDERARRHRLPGPAVTNQETQCLSRWPSCAAPTPGKTALPD